MRVAFDPATGRIRRRRSVENPTHPRSTRPRRDAATAARNSSSTGRGTRTTRYPAPGPRTRLGATYDVDTSAWSDADRARLVAELSVAPRVSSFGVGAGPPEPILFGYPLEEDPTMVRAPRFHGIARFGVPPAPGADERAAGLALPETVGPCLAELRSDPPQIDACAAVLAQLRAPGGGAMLILPCGFGKTVCAIHLLRALGRRAVVCVHKEFLLQQWVERLGAFLPGARVGRVQQKKLETDPDRFDVAVCMIQTLATRDYAPGTFDGFGTVIYDEAHHMSARVFSRCCEKLPGRHVIGLTATPKRSDGLDRCLPWLLGPVAYRASRETDADVPADQRPRAARVTFEGGKQKEMVCRWGPRRGQIEYARMVTSLTKETKRTNFVVELCELFAADPAGTRHLLVLSERVAHLDVIRKKLVKNGLFGDSVAIVKGGSKESEREHAFRQRVILSSYQYASEGLDVKILDTLIMASPPPGAKLEQVVGRVLRPCADKQRPYIVDVVDPFSVFNSTARKRVRLYTAQGFAQDVCTAASLRDELAGDRPGASASCAGKSQEKASS